MKKLFILSLIVMAPQILAAQNHYAYLAWDYNFPLSNKDWIKDSSPHGGMVGFRQFIRENQLSVGVDVNWTTFDQYELPQTFDLENGAITTDYFKYIYQYGAVVSAQYYHPLGNNIVYPYYGLGIGANYNRFAVYYNIYQEQQKAWGFLVRPEAGLLIRFGEHRSLGALAAVHYDYSTVKNKDYDYSGFSSVGWKIGIVLMSRD
jgi:hypothetical protein